VPSLRATRSAALLTIGYQGRSLVDLVRRLRAHDVHTLVDVREIARSRRPDFNQGRLADAVRTADIAYLHMPELGSKGAARRELYETGDFERFAGLYLRYVRRWRLAQVRQLCQLADRSGVVCILCYEADHEVCHRSIVANEAVRLKTKVFVQHL